VSLVDLATARALIQTDVGDTGLQLLLDAAEAEINARYGTLDEMGYTYERLDLTLENPNFLFLPRRISEPTADASIVTALTGTNNDLTLFSKIHGTGGNNIIVFYSVAGINTPLSVTVKDLQVTVHIATDGAGNPITVANEVVNAINGHATAKKIVGAAVAPGNNGSGVVTDAIFILAGGVGGIDTIVEKWGDEYSESTSFLLPDDFRIHYSGGALERLGNGTNPRWIWGHRVEVNYVPVDDTPRRKAVIVELVRLATRHSGVASQNIGGDISENSYGDYIQERRSIIESLGSAVDFS
jgi:hypothetical protein